MKYAPLKVRFSQKVIRGKSASDCWGWSGTKTEGYGMIQSEKSGRMVLAHRVSYELAFGPISNDICVLHTCDNPPCCNPSHLWLGTRGDNNRDKAAKGRAKSGRQYGETNPAAKLTWDKVEIIRVSKDHPAELAKRFGVSPRAIVFVQEGTTWPKRLQSPRKSKRPLKSSGRKIPSHLNSPAIF